MDNNNSVNMRPNVSGKVQNNYASSMEGYGEAFDKKSSGGLKIPRPLKVGFILVCFVLGIYFLILPFLPGISFLLVGSTPSIPYASKIESEIWKKANKSGEPANSEKKIVPEGRRLVIPAINVDMPIVEASDESGLAYGVWRRPNGGMINTGNMILTGHRLGYGFLPSEIMKSSSFYNLDKLNDGDFIVIYWDGEEYDYVVKGGETVLPTEVRIEDPTPEHRLTLYTCTPIGINTHRLVKYAFPVEKKVEDIKQTSSNSSVSNSSSIPVNPEEGN